MSVQLELGFEVRSHPNYEGAFAIYKNGKRHVQPGCPVYYETEQGAINRATQIIERMKANNVTRSETGVFSKPLLPSGTLSESREVRDNSKGSS